MDTKLSDAIDFTFPSGATIAPGSYLRCWQEIVCDLKKIMGLIPHFDWGGNNGALSNLRHQQNS